MFIIEYRSCQTRTYVAYVNIYGILCTILSANENRWYCRCNWIARDRAHCRGM